MTLIYSKLKLTVEGVSSLQTDLARRDGELAV